MSQYYTAAINDTTCHKTLLLKVTPGTEGEVANRAQAFVEHEDTLWSLVSLCSLL